MASDDPLVDADEAPAEDEGHDRGGAFAGYTLAADLLELREIYAGHLRRLPAAAWQLRTERRPSGWTLLETLAHLDAVALVFNLSVEQALAGQPIVIPGLAARSQIRAANRAAIAERLPLGPEALAESFLAALGQAARLAAGLSPAQLARDVETPYYGGRPSVGELLGASLAHAGIVHGAQIALPTRAPAIWSFYGPELMRRQLTRAFHTMARAYWPERGGSLHATLAFDVAGPGGGSWYVRVGPAGGAGQMGAVPTADTRLSFASADLLCRVFTFQASIPRSLLLRRMRVRGDLRLAARIPHLFMPT